MPGRLGIEIGGSHTDFVLAQGASAQTRALKLRNDQGGVSATVAAGAARILREAELEPADVSAVVATLPDGIEDVAPRRVGLVISDGFADLPVLAQGGQYLPEAIATVPGRVSASGATQTPLDEIAAGRHPLL